jgi:hypothetical protein
VCPLGDSELLYTVGWASDVLGLGAGAEVSRW